MADMNVPPGKAERAPKAAAKEVSKQAAVTMSANAAPTARETAGQVAPVPAAEQVAPAAAAGGVEVPEVLRVLALQSLERTRETYARLRATAEDTTDALEQSFETTRDGLLGIQFSALDAAKANADATFDLARKLLGVRSLTDAVELQTSFARERFEAMANYMQDVQANLTKVVSQSAAPAKTILDRMASDFRSAA